MMLSRAAAFVSLAVTLASPRAPAQVSLSLAQSGGGLGQTATFSLSGGANRVYVMWFDLFEYDTTLRPGVVAHVGLGLLPLSLQVPGFVGKLDANGAKAVTLNVPNDPQLAGLALSFEAVE